MNLFLIIRRVCGHVELGAFRQGDTANKCRVHEAIASSHLSRRYRADRFVGCPQSLTIFEKGLSSLHRCPTRQEADSINVARLNRLNGVQYNCPAVDKPGTDEEDRPYPPYKVNAALGRLVAPKDITLKACIVVSVRPSIHAHQLAPVYRSALTLCSSR